MNGRLAALQFHEHADRRLIHRDHHVGGFELFTVLFVSEPDVHAEAFENTQQYGAVGRHRLVLFANLDDAGQYRAFEREQALAALASYPQRRSLPAQRFVFGVEQGVLLEAAAVERRGAECEDLRPCLVGTVETKLDLALERHRFQIRVELVPYSLRTVKNCS